MSLKHVGRIKKNQRKIIVAYRTVPGDAHSAVVVTTENLMAEEHDALIKTVESDAGQSANEFAEAMARATLPDGRNMLAAFHTTGKMVKVETKTVEMQPDQQTTIDLDELNKMIAEQKGVSIDDLAITDSPVIEEAPAVTVSDIPTVAPTAASDGEVLTDEDLAGQYRSQADSLFKEAKRLREQAEELVPTKKKTKTAKSVVAA